MPLSDVIYGPRVWRPSGPIAPMTLKLMPRSSEIDVDTITDVATMILRAVPEGRIVYTVARSRLASDYQSYPVREEDLVDLADTERAALSLRLDNIEVDKPLGTLEVDLRSDSTTIYSSENLRSLAEQIAYFIADNGRPLPEWWRLARYRPYLAPIALASLFLWVELTTALTFPLHVFGWALVVAVTALAVVQIGKPDPYAEPKRGHLIVNESRAETARLRTASRANFRVGLRTALVTAPITFAGGFALAYAIYAAGIR